MNILYVGNPGFPIGYAQVERQKLISKGLIARGCDVTVINRYGVHFKETPEIKAGVDQYEGIHFTYATGSALRPRSFFERNLKKLSGLFLEFKLIKQHHKKRKCDGMIITTNSIWNVIYYSLIGKLFGIPTILDNTEYWSSHEEKKYLKKLDGYLYDSLSTKFVDKVICISDYLINHTLKVSPDKPVLKIPTIVDFSKFPNSTMEQEKYFLFCGIAANYEIIEFVIGSYERIQNPLYRLYIVSNGFPAEIKRIKNRIESSAKSKLITLFSKLEYHVLIKLYTSSQALLIPLRNSPRDFARFPHKIGEYCASARAIISTNFGEVKTYFTNDVNALLAADYDEELFAEQMNRIANNDQLSQQLGQRSYELGKKNFDYFVSGQKLFDFISLK